MLRTEETPSRLHDPVMLSEVLDMIALSEKTQNTFIDATLGLGGHAEKILEKMHYGDTFIGIDRDPENLERARSRLISIEGGKRQFFH
jgi:16S rRNA (cytosine1402-N4)-methyltransferase